VKTFKVIGLLLLVFVAGFAGGVVATRMIVRETVAYAIAHPAGAGSKVEAKLDYKLRLNDKQREQIHEILRQSREKLRDLREDFQPQFNAAVYDARTNISAILTPDQQRRFDDFLADNRQFLPIRDLAPKKEKGSSQGSVNGMLPEKKRKQNLEAPQP
jgi:hypothetical protein